MVGSTRNRTLDVTRGFAIIGMVFFTIIYQITQGLPDVLTHNVAGQMHLGDFVLPLFIFASGISAAYFIERRKEKKPIPFLLDVAERAALLIGVSFFLSPISSNVPFGMDEIMLAAIMFIFSVAFFPLPNWFYAIFSILLAGIYAFVVVQFGVSFFDAANLGGYPGAPFYLPVALAGLAIGKGLIKGNKHAAVHAAYVAFLLYVATLFFFPVDKLRVSPPFMYMSIVLGATLYVLFDFFMRRFNLQFDFLAYVGKNPLRYWVLMWVCFLIPLAFYYAAHGRYSLRLFDWPTASIISLTLLFLFAFLSSLLDKALIAFRNKRNTT